ncbi:MAG: uracil-DNA glycosylase [Candidatus Saccharibacteria bacterium]|nr:uracil-DNA glycosylase [Candidatus Saccharibacteria bacterium]
MTLKSKVEQLEELKKLILKNQPCQELARTANQLVFGSGNPDAEIVFVGEAPGKNEDIKGEPFVGASGKMLDEMLSSINIDRKEVYITNIVKYRPPENRDPTALEKAEFWPYLLKQIAIIKPKLIATLGRHSGQAFIESLRISADHGKPKKVKLATEGAEEYMTVLPLYHPAAALYNGSLKQTLLKDFMSVSQLLKNN